jgi:hypothetical protein
MKIASETSQFFFRILPAVDPRVGRGLTSAPRRHVLAAVLTDELAWQPSRSPRRGSGSPGCVCLVYTRSRDDYPVADSSTPVSQRAPNGPDTDREPFSIAGYGPTPTNYKRIGHCGLIGQGRPAPTGRCGARSGLGRGCCKHFCSCCTFPSRTGVPCRRHRVLHRPLQNAKTGGGSARHMSRLRDRSGIRYERSLEPPTRADMRIVPSQSDRHIEKPPTDLNHTTEHRPAHHLFHVAPCWVQNYFQTADARANAERGPVTALLSFLLVARHIHGPCTLGGA